MDWWYYTVSPPKTSTFVFCWITLSITVLMPSVLWRCWLGGRKGIRPLKNKWWGAGVVICLERVADLHMALLMPLPLTVYCFSKIQIGFIFLVPAHLGSLGKKGPLNGCVCVTLSKLKPILTIFGVLNPEKSSHKNLTDLCTSPVRCSHFTLGNPKKSF